MAALYRARQGRSVRIGDFDVGVGDFVRHPARLDWGDDQVQSIIGQIVTVTFEEAEKQVIHAEHIALELVAEKTKQARNR